MLHVCCSICVACMHCFAAAEAGACMPTSVNLHVHMCTCMYGERVCARMHTYVCWQDGVARAASVDDDVAANSGRVARMMPLCCIPPDSADITDRASLLQPWACCAADSDHYSPPPVAASSILA